MSYHYTISEGVKKKPSGLGFWEIVNFVIALQMTLKSRLFVADIPSGRQGK